MKLNIEKDATPGVCEVFDPMSANQLKDFRLSLGMTQSEFATFVGTKVGTIASWESGRKMSAIAKTRIVKLHEHRGPIISQRQLLEQAIRQASAQA